MSLGVVLGATDGLLVLADGRRAQLTWTPGAPNWLGDGDMKPVLVAGAPIAVVTVGRAGFGEIDNHILIENEIALMDEADRKDPSVVAAICRELLTDLDEQHDRPHGTGTSTLVVGYDEAGQRVLDIFHVPPRTVAVVDRFDAYPALTFMPGSVTAAELAAEFSLFVEVAEDEQAGDDDWRWTANEYRYDGMLLAEMRPLALDRMGEWLTKNARMATSDGVGGQWLVAELRPGTEAAVEGVGLGPRGDASQNVPI